LKTGSCFAKRRTKVEAPVFVKGAGNKQEVKWRGKEKAGTRGSTGQLRTNHSIWRTGSADKRTEGGKKRDRRGKALHLLGGEKPRPANSVTTEAQEGRELQAEGFSGKGKMIFHVNNGGRETKGAVECSKTIGGKRGFGPRH